MDNEFDWKSCFLTQLFQGIEILGLLHRADVEVSLRQLSGVIHRHFELHRRVVEPEDLITPRVAEDRVPTRPAENHILTRTTMGYTIT